MKFTTSIAAAVLSSYATASPLLGLGGSDPARVPISNDLFAKLSKYGGYAKSAGTVPCAHAPFGSSVVGYVNINITDTQVTVYRNDGDKEFVVAIPGSASTQDYVTDFEFVPLPYFKKNLTSCIGCLVHSGFLGAWASADAGTRALVDAGLKQYPGYTVSIAGYSLGGALAQLAFLSFETAGYPLTQVFTYGQPRVGNPPFADYTDALSGATELEAGIYHRTTHSIDGVPQLPPQLLGFRHPRTEYFELDGPAGTPTAETTYRCFGQEAADCSNSIAQPGFNAAHRGYAGINSTTPYCTS